MVKVYVGNVPSHARAADVRGLFEKYGMVTDCDVIKNYAFIHFTNAHDANAAIDGLDDCEFMGNTIHVEMSKNQSHKPGPRRDARNDGRSDAPPQMQMPPGGYNMPGMPYVPPPMQMPPAGYGMPPMQMPMGDGSNYNGASAGGSSSGPSSAYPGYPPPYGMPYPPPPMPVFSSEQFKEYFKRYGCLPPLPPMYGGGSHSSRRRSRSRSDSRSPPPRRSSRRSHSRSPRRGGGGSPPPRSREYRDYDRAYSPRRERRYSRSPRR